jgi:hypothetical protein
MPSEADACLSGSLQYQFCIGGDPDGPGSQLPDSDCDDGYDSVLRTWTENPVLTVAPQASNSYVTEVRCSTAPDCLDTHKVDVSVICPGGVNALGLYDVRAVEVVQGSHELRWGGDPLTVDCWESDPLTQIGMGAVANYAGSSVTCANVTAATIDTGSVNPGQARAYLVKADGPTTGQTLEVGQFCNARTWRSGSVAEVPEDTPGRDTVLGDP